jgi:uncharacterized membrane protein
MAMSSTVSRTNSPWDTVARWSLKASVRFWFLAIMAGQLIFAVSISILYGLKAVRGDLPGWNRAMTHGYVPGQGIGNLIVGVHIASAAIILAAGTFQFIPRIRARAPALHRWSGRLYILSAFTISLAGLYMMWFRGTVGDLPQHLGNSGLALVIMVCAAMTIRQARARDFASHRRWAVRLFIAVSASLFIRASITLVTIIAGGPFGFDPATSSGPLLTFIGFAQYLVPLGIFEIYLRARNGGPGARMTMAAGLTLATLSIVAGLGFVTASIWVPDIRAGLDPRRSITGVLSSTIADSGIDSGIAHYHALRASQSKTYNFDERELNSLGYTYLRLRKYAEAIRIFQLNVEMYPHSGNTYDSLAEAYMDAGNNKQAIANYQQSVDRDPKNLNALRMISKLKALGGNV